MKHAKTSNLTLGDFEVPAGPDGQPAVIGRGSFGVVYRAMDRRSGEEVALKVLNEHVSTDEKAVARFKEETREHKRLNHPGIVSIQDSGDFGNQLYYSMEFCRGGDLAAYSKSQGPLEPIHALKIIQQVADALVYASGHYLLHRDIKPGNILLVHPPVSGQIPKVKLTDFGLSKISVDLDSIRRPQMSLLGGFHGTLQYASPEQVMEDPLDVRSDIFSLGLTLWHLLVGGYPLGSQKEHELINDRIDDRAYADRFPKEWPPPLALLLGRMLEKKPEKRFRGFGELTRVLEDCIESLAGTNGAQEVKRAKGKAAPLKEYFTQIDRKKKRPLGILHTARMLPTDGVGDPSPCHFLLLESNLDPATMEALRTVVGSLGTNPHPNIAGLDWQETLDGQALIIHSPPDGQTLLNTIRKEGKHALAAVQHLLEQAASANDHARSLGLELNAHPRDVYLLFDFTGTRLLFTASLPGDDAHEAGPSGGTIAGTMMGEGPSAPGDSALMDFATLLYWMVSARMPVSAAYVNPNAYKAIEGLGETGNSLVRDALCRRWSGNCLEFFAAICREEGLPPPRIPGMQTVAPSVSRHLSAPEPTPPPSRGSFISTASSVDSAAKPPISQYPSRTGSLANSRAGGLFARQREQRQREIEEKQRQLEEERRKLEEEQEKAAEMEAYLQEVEQGLAEQHELERQQLEELYKQQMLAKEEETSRLRLEAERAEQEKAAMLAAYEDVEKGFAEKLDLERQQLEVTFQQQLRAKEEETNRLRLAAERAEQERQEALRLAEQKEAERLAALEHARSGSPLSPEDSESLKSAREEALRLRQEAEAERKAAADKLRQAEEEAARKAEEAKRIAEEAAAEAKRKAEAEAAEAKRLAEEEARKVREAAEAERKAAAEQLRIEREEAERKAAEARQKAEKEAAEARLKAEQEAAEKLRRAHEEAERKAAEAKRKAEQEAAEAKRKAEQEAAEAKRKAEAEARALREEAAKEKERAKKEAEKIRAAAREGKSKPFLPLPALAGMAAVLLVGGFFAARSLLIPEQNSPTPPPPPPPPPPVTDNGEGKAAGTDPIPLPPPPPAPKTWHSTWKLEGTVGEVEVIRPEGVELTRDDRLKIELKEGEPQPTSITFKDDVGEFTLVLKNNEWREQKSSSAEKKTAPSNIEFQVEAPNLPQMVAEFGACALQLKGVDDELPVAEKTGKASARLRLDTDHEVSVGFENLRFGEKRMIPVFTSPPVKSGAGEYTLKTLTAKVPQEPDKVVRIRLPDLLVPNHVELAGKIQCKIECRPADNKAEALDFLLPGGDKKKSYEHVVMYGRKFEAGCVAKKDGTFAFAAKLKGELTIFYEIVKTFRDALDSSYPATGEDAPGLEPGENPDGEKSRSIAMAQQLHYYYKNRPKPPASANNLAVEVNFIPEGLLDGKVLYSYLDDGKTFYAWWQEDGALMTSEPVRSIMEALNKISAACDFDLKSPIEPDTTNLLRPQ